MSRVRRETKSEETESPPMLRILPALLVGLVIFAVEVWASFITVSPTLGVVSALPDVSFGEVRLAGELLFLWFVGASARSAVMLFIIRGWMVKKFLVLSFSIDAMIIVLLWLYVRAEGAF